MGKRATFNLIAIAFFAVSVALTYGEVFNYALFLASYPSHWLSYLFLGTVVLNCMLFIALVPLFKKHDKRINRAIIGILIILCSILAILLPLNYYWLPFIFAFYYSLLFPTLTIISYNLATDCFSIREFKQYSTRLRATGTVGIILSAFSVNYLTTHFGQQSILYLTLAALCVIEAVLFVITPSTPARQTKLYDKVQVWNFPLARALLPMVTLMALGYYFSDYLFKFKLSEELNRQQIADFLGNFICALNIIAFFTQMIITQMIINRYGVVFLFYIAPTVIALGIILTLLYPSLLAFTLYSFAVSITYWCFHLIAFEMALSPLPLQIRLAAKTLEGGVLEFIGQGVTAIFFITLAYFTTNEKHILYLVAFFSISYCLPWYSLINRAQELYKQALQKSIRLRGFLLGEFCIPQGDKISKEDLAENLSGLLNSKFHSLGFSLILDGPAVDQATRQLLKEKTENFNNFLTLQSLRSEEDGEQSLESLIDRLQNENESAAIWKMTNRLMPLHGKSTLPLVKNAFQEEISPKQVYLTAIAFAHGDLELLNSAMHILQEALSHPDSKIRLAAASVLGTLRIGAPETELKTLMEDPDPEVVMEAMHAAASRHTTALIPMIAKNLGKNTYTHSASGALQLFNEDSLPFLKDIIHDETKLVSILAAIKTLVHLSGPNTEEAILRIAKHSNATIRTRMAYWALTTAATQKRSAHFLQQIYPLIRQEAKNRMKLKEALKLKLPSYLHKEFKIKLHLCSLRCLYWFGSCVDPKTVIQLISPLKDIDFGPPAQPERFHSTLELLNSLTSDKTLQKMISEWEQEPVGKPQDIRSFLNIDPYLNVLIEHYCQKEELVDDTISKLVALREVSLFEKLSADVLFVVAREAEWRNMTSGEVLFAEGDAPDGLYIIVNGNVCVTAKGRELSRLKDFDFFGEVGLIDNCPRLATATAESNGLLLYIDQITFDDLINEFPDVLRSITITIIGYLLNPPHG